MKKAWCSSEAFRSTFKKVVKGLDKEGNEIVAHTRRRVRVPGSLSLRAFARLTDVGRAWLRRKS